ncbi:hypothetical protein ACQUSR_27660 [Streptomyces sp. P1-3]|uniref:hypothetical protein n=1 Tax=Streptomyces sp. P1-3 TaxID=3421658 RepID=UPI003D361F7A
MSTRAGHEEPSPDISTWAMARLWGLAGEAEGQQLEVVRVAAQGRAYRSGESREARRQWARLSLHANRRLRENDPRQRARADHLDFMLRTWVIDHLGPDEDEPDFAPETLASDTLAALALTPADARALAVNWCQLPVDQIQELRRHKNLTAHLSTLANYLQLGPSRDQLLIWLQTREELPG